MINDREAYPAQSLQAEEAGRRHARRPFPSTLRATEPGYHHRALYVVDPSSNETTSAALVRNQTIPFSTQSTRLIGMK